MASARRAAVCRLHGQASLTTESSCIDLHPYRNRAARLWFLALSQHRYFHIRYRRAIERYRGAFRSIEINVIFLFLWYFPIPYRRRIGKYRYRIRIAIPVRQLGSVSGIRRCPGPVCLPVFLWVGSFSVRKPRSTWGALRCFANKPGAMGFDDPHTWRSFEFQYLQLYSWVLDHVF
jgi:hypothetical protein